MDIALLFIQYFPFFTLFRHTPRRGKTMTTLTHHKKSVQALAIHPTEYSFASGSAGGNNIKSGNVLYHVNVQDHYGIHFSTLLLAALHVSHPASSPFTTLFLTLVH
jgi:hypothetical protein